LFRLACVQCVCVCVCLCKQMFLIDRRLLIRSVFLWLGTAFHFYLTHTHTHTLFTLIISVCLIGWGKFSVCVCVRIWSLFLSPCSCPALPVIVMWECVWKTVCVNTRHTDDYWCPHLTITVLKEFRM